MTRYLRGRDFTLLVRAFLLIGFVAVIAFSIMIIGVSAKTRSMAREEAFDKAREIAYGHGTRISTRISDALSSARTLANALQAGLKHRELLNRTLYDQMFIEEVKNSDDFVFGAWAVFEPGRFDGRDAEFAGREGQAKDGGYIPYAYHKSGKFVFKHDEYQLDKDSDYYTIPKRTRRECLIDPYVDPDAENVLMSSVAVPVFDGEEVVAVAGIDILLTSFKDAVSEVRPYSHGYAFLIGNNGLIVGHPNKSLAGRSVTELGVASSSLQAIRNGIEVQEQRIDGGTNVETYFRFVPIRIGMTATPWSFCVAIPMDEILAKAEAVTRWSIVAGAASLFVLAVVLFALIGAVVLPLRRSELALSRVFDHVHDAVIVHGKDGEILDVNERMLSLFSLSREKALQMNVGTDLSAAGQGTDRLRPEWDAALSGNSRFMEWTARRPENGTEFVAELFLCRMDLVEEPVITATVHDISERKRSERELRKACEDAEAANKAKSDFLAMMSHELRTPLSSILAYSLLMSDSEGPVAAKMGTEAREFSRRIATGARHLLKLIEEILLFARIEAGKVGIKPQKFRLSEVMDFVRGEAEALRQEDHVALELHTPPHEVVLKTDQMALHQIVLNLLGNAFKFTASGTIRIEFSVQNQDLHLLVQDTGIGIPEADLENVFLPFFQVSTGKRRRYGGTGLGLSVVTKLLDELHGSIQVKNVSGGGTSFEVNFPNVVVVEDDPLKVGGNLKGGSRSE
ncbi:MAG: ATP-binding protein [Candidatus Ozemobacteraceae bacterium]